MREGTLEREVMNDVDVLMSQLSDLVNVISGDIDADEAGTSVVDEIATTRDAWAVLAKSLTKLRAKHRRRGGT